ncbi:LysM peptidoglycan-binding domain-containing protein [Paenibacillus sp. P26]|nr:LysM peptidoglycan-binding domain-containing protein [Paenibacillus sp. P26]
MQIHVIQPGQTLYQLSQAYGVMVKTIAEANELDTTETLVVGQAIVIPITGQYYWVRPGDTLPRIAQAYGIPAARLAEVNQIAVDQPLTAGTRLYIPRIPTAPPKSTPISSPGGRK